MALVFVAELTKTDATGLTISTAVSVLGYFAIIMGV